MFSKGTDQLAIFRETPKQKLEMPLVNIYICYTRWDGLEPCLTIAVQMAEVVVLSQT